MSKICIIPAFLAVLWALGACSAPVDGKTEGDASFSITINGGGRTVLAWDPDKTDSAALKHTITLTNGSGPDVMQDGIEEGETAYFTVAPGYWEITVWAFLDSKPKAYGFVGQELTPGPNSVTINMGPPRAFDITMRTDGNGTAIAEPNPAAAGSTVEIYATPDIGFMFTEWQVISGGVTLSDPTVNQTEFTMPTGPVTIKAVFSEVPSNTPYLYLSDEIKFPAVPHGYTQPAAHTVTITNSGTATAFVSNIALGGTNAASFILGGNNLTPTIAAGESASFTVQPKGGLDAGTYNAAITVSYSGGEVESAEAVTDVSFTVNATVINSVNISITVPVNGAAPGAASGSGNFTIGPVSWSPSDNPFLGDKVYTASVTLTANSNHTFTGLSSATITGQDAKVTDNTGSTVTLSRTFTRTDPRIVTNIAIKQQPTKLTYTHGDKLELTGLVVTLTYDTDETEDVAAAFGDKGVTVKPSAGDNLIHSTHDGQPVKILYGDHLTRDTDKLTVKKAEPTAEDFSVSGTGTFDYDGNPRSVEIAPKDGKSDGDITVKYNDNKIAPSAVGVYTVTFDVKESENYTEKAGLIAGTLTINTAKVSIAAIPGVTAPKAGETPVAAIIPTAQYTGTVTWEPKDSTFKSTKTYTATITLTVKDGYTLQGVEAGFFRVTGAATVSYSAGSDIVTAVFPATHGAAGIAINLWVNEDKQILDLSNNNVTISKGGAVKSFTATVNSGYTDIQWLMLGVPLGSGASITVNAADYNTGIYRINVIVHKNAVAYSTEIRFTVTN